MKALPILVISLLVNLLAAQQTANWIQCPLNGHYYTLTPPGTWESTEQWALANDSHLVTIRSQLEENWLLVTFSSPGSRHWIGLNDLASAGTWTWVSGEPANFLNWDGGEPNYFGVERRAELLDVGRWNNQSNWIRQGIAERRPHGAYSAFGTSCLGPSSSLPALSPSPGSTPAIGGTSTIHATGIVSQIAVVVFVLGLTNEWDGSGSAVYPLPMDLGLLGWPGCQQFVAIQDVHYTITTTGLASHEVSIPSYSFLVGMDFYAQAMVLYHPTGVAVTNGLRGHVGY